MRLLYEGGVAMKYLLVTVREREIYTKYSGSHQEALEQMLQEFLEEIPKEYHPSDCEYCNENCDCWGIGDNYCIRNNSA